MSPTLTALGVIPARLASTRLPRKVLRDVAGKPLIVRVHEAARRSPDLADVLVATDAQEVIAACARFRVPAVLTSPEHLSGTDRVWEVAQSRAAPDRLASAAVMDASVKVPRGHASAGHTRCHAVFMLS